MAQFRKILAVSPSAPDIETEKVEVPEVELGRCVDLVRPPLGVSATFDDSGLASVAGTVNGDFDSVLGLGVSTSDVDFSTAPPV